MEITLDRLRIEQQAVITHLDTDATLSRRLRAFGMVPGTRVRCRCRCPGGNVTALELRGSVVALRNRDLKHIRGYCL